MKNALLTALQFVLFYLLFFAGSLLSVLDPMHPRWFIHSGTPGGPPASYFVPEGLLLTLLVYLCILLIEAARKRLTLAGRWTTLALVLALVLGFLSKFGIVHPS